MHETAVELLALVLVAVWLVVVWRVVVVVGFRAVPVLPWRSGD